MVEIGGQPVLWHIMRGYAHYGFNEFVLALGYKGEVIKRFFLDYFHLQSHLTVTLGAGEVKAHDGLSGRDDWLVHMVDTGATTQTGGRIKRLKEWVGNETFMVTYGDGVCSANIADILRFHREHGRIATVTAVRPPARFGGLSFEGDFVTEFSEKPQIGEGWINGGFFVLEPEIFDYIEDDNTFFERDPLERIANDKQLVAYRHDGFWQCMDTLRDVRTLESLWMSGEAPWANWKNEK
jgi:glucose-1-phosphate cytidylyltransferase